MRIALQRGPSVFWGQHNDSFIKLLSIRILSYFYLVLSVVAVEREAVSLTSTASVPAFLERAPGPSRAEGASHPSRAGQA